MSTQSAQARLKDGLRELQQAWRQANEQWNDQAAAEFHKDIVEPLEPRVSSALTAMGELGTAPVRPGAKWNEILATLAGRMTTFPTPATSMKSPAERAGTDGPFMTLEREAYTRLVTITRETAATRERVEREYAEATRLNDQRLEQGLAEADATFEREKAAADGEHRAAIERNESRHREDIATADQTRLREREVARERGDHDVSLSRAKFEESKWFAETSFDTDRVKYKAARQADQITIAAMTARIGSAKTGVETVLQTWRQGLALDVPTRAYTGEDAGGEFESAMQKTADDSAAMQRYRMPLLIRGLTPWALIIVLAIVGAVIGAWTQKWAVNTVVFGAFFGGAIVGGLLVFAAYRQVKVRSVELLKPVIEDLSRARGAADVQAARFEADDKRRREEAKSRLESDVSKARQKHDEMTIKVRERLQEIAGRIDEAHSSGIAGAEEARKQRAADAERVFALAQTEARRQHEGTTGSLREAHARERERVQRSYDEAWSVLGGNWSAAMMAIKQAIDDTEDRLAANTLPWSDLSRQLRPSDNPTPVIAPARVRVDVGAMVSGFADDARLPCGLPAQIDWPVPLELPSAASLLLLTSPEQRQQGTELLTSAMLRLLTSVPPGKARFTIIDPIGLGQSFAGFMRLAEFATTSGSLVGERIWTEARHIEQKLADITEHMETVIQKYLRNQYATIDEYNKAAGEVAEPYRFVVIADFPGNFSESAAKRLESILASGPRCGVYVLIAATRKDNLPQGIRWADLVRACRCMALRDGAWVWDDADFSMLPVSVESPPTPEQFARIIDAVGTAATEASRVRVPFSSITPQENKVWTRSSADGLTIPLGRAGATKHQQLSLGHGTQQHVLIAGRTGSGKSTLLHIIITAGAMWYSPDELELYLVDFKKGVEFKTYGTHHLPHARVIAVESEREFGLSVLRKLDAELTRRGDLFRAAGSQSLGAYRSSANAETMPRTLLVVDEFQEFFIEDDKLAQESGLLLDRLIRQGRAFGMHVILGSQTLAGAYSLARSTIGQMGVRIALQCSEADSYLILADDNPAARLLNRPGEAIYNDASGMLEGNNPFQVCWLDEAEREVQLDQLRARATSDPAMTYPPAIVFEGNAPADIRDNAELESALSFPATNRPAAFKVHLGAPISIKEPTGAIFRRRSASNLLLVGQNEEQMLGMLAAALLGLAIQDAGCSPSQRGRFHIIDGTPSDSPLDGTLAKVARAIGPRAEMIDYRSVPQAIAALHDELQTRLKNEHGATDREPRYLVIAGAQRFRSLQRGEDDFGFGGGEESAKPDKHLATIIREGPMLGVHVILWCDSGANLDRIVKRQTLGEFNARVLLQMSVNDSSNLIDSPAGGQLGRDRALLFSEERGTIEKFRPYEVPRKEWFTAVQMMLNG